MRTFFLVGALTATLLMPACRIPGDATTPGATPTPASTLTFEQRFAKDLAPQESAVTATLHGKVVYQNTLAPIVGTPSPSAMTLRSGILEPGTYHLTAVQHECDTSCASPGKVLSKCDIQVVVEENQPVDAIIHVGRKSCFIEVG